METGSAYQLDVYLGTSVLPGILYHPAAKADFIIRP